MSYIDHVIEHRTHFRVERKGDSAVFGPVDQSDAAVMPFQSLVRDLEIHEGDGYAIRMIRRQSDQPGAPADLVSVTLRVG